MATTLEPTTTTTVLRGKLASDGTIKMTLAAREEGRLRTAASLCLTLSLVQQLSEKAKNAAAAIEALLEDVASDV